MGVEIKYDREDNKTSEKQIKVEKCAPYSDKLVQSLNCDQLFATQCLKQKNNKDLLWASLVKNLPAMRETWVRSLGQEDPLEEGMVAHSSILAWRIPRTEEPDGLQSIESHD